VEFPKVLSGFFEMHVPKPSCKIWGLDDIRCYPNSTLPLSEERALAIHRCCTLLWLWSIVLYAADVWYVVHQLLHCCCDCIVAFDTTTANATSVLQLPLKCCICYAASTAIANTASVLQLSCWEKQLKTPKTEQVSSGYTSVLKSWLLLVSCCLLKPLRCWSSALCLLALLLLYFALLTF